MNKETPNTEELIQKIVNRQAELAALSTTILKAKPTKKESKIKYTWFWNEESKNDVFGLSKAV